MTITEQLNTYSGDNVWQDVILKLDGYDETATDQIDTGDNTRFVADGVEYTYDQQEKLWRAADEYDAEGYDQYGYDRRGYSRAGYNRMGGGHPTPQRGFADQIGGAPRHPWLDR